MRESARRNATVASSSAIAVGSAVATPSSHVREDALAVSSGEFNAALQRVWGCDIGCVAARQGACGILAAFANVRHRWRPLRVPGFDPAQTRKLSPVEPPPALVQAGKEFEFAARES